MKNITTFEDACKKLGIDPLALPVVTGLPEKHQKAIVAHYKLVIIAEAINDGWTPNWNDYSQCKYYPWFRVEANNERFSGFGLSYGGCGITSSLTVVGSRLCYFSSDAAEYAGTQFKELYEESYLIK